MKKIFLLFLILIMILLVGCNHTAHIDDSTLHTENTEKESTALHTENINEDIMIESLKKIVSNLKFIESQIEQYNFHIEFYYKNGELVCNSNEMDILNTELISNIEKVLQNQYVYGISWDYSQILSEFYLTVGIKTVHSGFNSVIMRDDGDLPYDRVYLADDWYYCEFLGE